MKSLALVAVVLCSGCDTFRGVVRYTAEMPVSPSVECVKEALESVEGVSNVVYSFETKSNPSIGGTHRYWYEFRGLKSHLFIHVRNDGWARYHHSHGCLNCNPTQEAVDQIYPVMLAIDRAVTDRCNLEGQIEQLCSGVKCSAPNKSLERTREE